MGSKAVPTKFPEKLLDELNDAVEEGYYANRSELVRDAVRERLRELKAERLEEAVKEDVEWGLKSDR
ncbi:MAG: ribbon-helix-helix domain-containing protein [Candidatus Nanohaloarchaea archaeon]